MKNKLTELLLQIIPVFAIIGGLYIKGVAIIFDAIHDLGDSLSLRTAWYLDRKSRQGADRGVNLCGQQGHRPDRGARTF